MFADYQKQVLLTYHKMKADNTLSPNLLNSTPGRLRDECVTVFHERYNHHEDEKTLRRFFGYHENGAAYIRTIGKFDIDKFRPLDKFLKSHITETHEKNIELLSWLIGFEPRPYKWDFDYGTLSGSDSHPEKPVEENTAEDEMTDIYPWKTSREQAEIKITGPGQPAKKTNSARPANSSNKMGISPPKIAIMLLFLGAISGVVTYLAKLNSQEKCMCWTGDRYQSASCNQQTSDKPVYALDTLKLTHFRRITRPDTITRNSLGHVWYSKIDNVVEFYTADGFHPVHTERKLKPLTDYIRGKYITSKSFPAVASN